MLARPARRATYHRALGSGKLIPQNELRRSEGSGMLIGDPLGEGSNASSTNSVAVLLFFFFFLYLRRSYRSGIPKVRGAMLALLIMLRMGSMLIGDPLR